MCRSSTNCRNVYRVLTLERRNFGLDFRDLGVHQRRMSIFGDTHVVELRLVLCNEQRTLEGRIFILLQLALCKFLAR